MNNIIWFSLAVISFCSFSAHATLNNPAGHEKTIPCDDKTSRVVRVATGRLTIINFPFRPKDLAPGENIFDFKQVKNDLLIRPLRNYGRTNIVVYLDERRCSYDLIIVHGQGDGILTVKDPKDSQYEVKIDD